MNAKFEKAKNDINQVMNLAKLRYRKKRHSNVSIMDNDEVHIKVENSGEFFC